MEKRSWAERARKEKVLPTVKEGWYSVQTLNRRKEERLNELVTYCVGTAFLKHVTEGKIEGMLEVTGR